MRLALIAAAAATGLFVAESASAETLRVTLLINDQGQAQTTTWD